MSAAESRNHRPERERGSFTLELTVLFPVFLVLVLMIVQAALYFFARSIALSAAEQGADTARLQGQSTAQGASTATTFATSQGGGVLTELAVSTGSTPTQVTITVTGRALTIVPGLGFTIRQVASAPRENYTTAVTAGDATGAPIGGGP